MGQPSWFNQNENRAYPFVLRTVALAVTDPAAIANLPDAAIVDCGFILGTGAQFLCGRDTVRLARIRRLDGIFYFDFLSDAPGTYGDYLTFSRPVDSTEYVTEDADSSAEYGISFSESESELGDVCLEPVWHGFLVTGDLAELAVLLPADGELPGAAGDGLVEPGLIQNLSGAYVSSVSLANDDRTRVAAPEDCDEVSWPVEPQPLWVKAVCLRDTAVFMPGYNMVIGQSDQDNAILFTPEKGAGAGEPCGEVPLFDGEEPPDGSILLGGGPACNETVRSFNGIGGRQLAFTAGLGVQITAVPLTNTLVVDANFTGLALCQTGVSEVSETV